MTTQTTPTEFIELLAEASTAERSASMQSDQRPDSPG